MNIIDHTRNHTLQPRMINGWVRHGVVKHWAPIHTVYSPALHRRPWRNRVTVSVKPVKFSLCYNLYRVIIITVPLYSGYFCTSDWAFPQHALNSSTCRQSIIPLAPSTKSSWTYSLAALLDNVTWRLPGYVSWFAGLSFYRYAGQWFAGLSFYRCNGQCSLTVWYAIQTLYK